MILLLKYKLSNRQRQKETVPTTCFVINSIHNFQTWLKESLLPILLAFRVPQITPTPLPGHCQDLTNSETPNNNQCHHTQLALVTLILAKLLVGHIQWKGWLICRPWCANFFFYLLQQQKHINPMICDSQILILYTH